MKVRVNLTVQDYYNYISSNPYYSLRERVLQSLPSDFGWDDVKIHKMNFKVLKSNYYQYYRVHMICTIQEDFLKDMEERYARYGHRPTKISYKILSE